MRFKASLTTQSVTSILLPLLSPFPKLNPLVSLRLSPELVTLSTKAPNGHRGLDGLTLYCELTADGVFSFWKIESVCDNEIAMEVDPSHLRQAFANIVSSASGGGGFDDESGGYSMMQGNDDPSAVVANVKLARRNGMPCLCVESANGRGVKISHDIPVLILRTSEFAKNRSPPSVSTTPTSQLYLPGSRSIKTVVERMRPMGNEVYVEGDMGCDSGEEMGVEGEANGSLRFHVFGEGASVATVFDSLKAEPEGCTGFFDGSDDEGGAMEVGGRKGKGKCKVKIASKKLLEMFRWQSMLPIGKTVSRSIVSLFPDEMLVVHSMLNGYDPTIGEVGFFTYYCPVQYLEADDDEE